MAGKLINYYFPENMAGKPVMGVNISNLEKYVRETNNTKGTGDKNIEL